MAAGADGLMVEVHSDPDKAVSDSAQTIGFPALDSLLEKLRAMAPIFGRTMS